MKSKISINLNRLRPVLLVLMSIVCLTAMALKSRVKVFTDEQRKSIPEVYSDFIERVIAELAEANEPTASQMASRYLMQLTAGQYDMTAAAHTWAMGLTNLLDANPSFTFGYDGDYMTSTWAYDTTRPYTMRVKIARETFEGTDKAEADSLMAARLRDIRPSGYMPVIPQKNQLVKTSESDMLVLPGEYFVIPSTNGDTYYLAKKGYLAPIYSDKYPVESLKNLMQSVINNDYMLELNVPLYGGKTERFTLPLKDFTDYWKTNDDYEVYSDVSPSERGYKVTHIALHRLLKYANITIINFGHDDFSRPNATLTCTTVLNVPQHNIGNLFPDK